MRPKSGQSLYLHMVYLTCCFLIWILCTGSIGTVEGRRLTEDDFFRDSIAKRNSWWSKKSLENVPNYQNGNPPKLQNENQDCDKMLDIFKCYAETCVPDFVACSRFENDVYDLCKDEHDLCAARCFMPDSTTLKR